MGLLHDKAFWWFCCLGENDLFKIWLLIMASCKVVSLLILMVFLFSGAKCHDQQLYGYFLKLLLTWLEKKYVGFIESALALSTSGLKFIDKQCLKLNAMKLYSIYRFWYQDYSSLINQIKSLFSQWKQFLLKLSSLA